MIFVTVGTHEQPFNRLIKKVDELKRDGIIKEDVIMQIGFSTYEPKYCEFKKLFSYDEMIQNVKKARIVITHGGPSSFIMPLQEGKIPVVVPRKLKFHEHVNDHQVEFVKMENKRYKNIIIVEDEKNLGKCISEYDNIVAGKNKENINNNDMFNDKLKKIVDNLMKR